MSADKKASELADWCDKMGEHHLMEGSNRPYREIAKELRRLEEEIKEWNVAYHVWDGTLAFRERRIAELETKLAFETRDGQNVWDQSDG